MKQIGIFAATRWECDAVCRALRVDGRLSPEPATICHSGPVRVIVARTGMGPARARGVCGAILQRYALDGLISSGFAGALIPAAIGDLLIGTEVVLADERGAGGGETRWSCTEAMISRAQRAAEAAGIPWHRGSIVTVSHIVGRAAEKRLLAARIRAIGVDMESAAIGAVAAEHHLPFVVVRAVSDLLDEDLPVDFNLFLHRRHWPRAIWSLARPSAAIGLLRLRRHTAMASARITALFERFFDEGSVIQKMAASTS